MSDITSKYIIPILFSFFLSGCSFNFSEDYYNDISPLEVNTAFSLDPFEEGETLTASKKVNYSFNGNGQHQLYSAQVFVDNSLVYGSSSENGSFDIDVDDLSSGEHTLKIEYQYSSGTGSLADINGAERQYGSIEYKFNVDKSGPPQIELTKVEVVEGTIQIYWNPIQKNNFEEASLKVFNKEDSRLLRELTLTSEIIDGLHFNDTLSTELSIDFSLTLKNRYAETNSNVLGINLEPPTLRGEIINSSQYKIIWSEHPLYGNFDYYEYNVRPNNTFVSLSNRGGEYIVDDVPVFGQQEYHSLALKRENGFESLHYVGDIVHFGIEFGAKNGVNYVYSALRNTIFTVVLEGSSSYNSPRNVVLYELDPMDLSILRTKTFFTIYDSFANLVIDPTTGNLVLDLSETSYSINIDNLDIIGNWTASDFTSDTYGIMTSYRNGFLVVEKYTGEVSIYNATNANLLYQSIVDYSFFISDDGNAFINNGILYKWNGTAFESILTIPKNGNVAVHTAMFIPNSNLCVYSNVYGNPVIFNHETMSESIVGNVTGIYYLNYDSITQKLCMFQQKPDDYIVDIAYLVDLNGNLEKNLNVFENNWGLKYYYLNGQLVGSNGLYLNTYF